MLKDFIFSIVPFLFICSGAIYSKKAGTLAVFLEGAITLGAFSSFVALQLTSSFIISITLGAFIPGILFFFFEKFNEVTNANPFITGIAINLCITGFTSMMSYAFFGKSGVLYFSTKPANSFIFLFIIAILSFSFLIFTEYFLYHSKKGLTFRICESGGSFLDSLFIDRKKIRSISWGICGATGGLAGSFLSIRLASFSTGISGGKGWIALALIYLASDKPHLVLFWTSVLSLTEFFARWLINNFTQMSQIQTLLQAIPFIAVLIFSGFSYFIKKIYINKKQKNISIKKFI